MQRNIYKTQLLAEQIRIKAYSQLISHKRPQPAPPSSNASQCREETLSPRSPPKSLSCRSTFWPHGTKNCYLIPPCDYLYPECCFAPILDYFHTWFGSVIHDGIHLSYVIRVFDTQATASQAYTAYQARLTTSPSALRVSIECSRRWVCLQPHALATTA